MRAGRFFYGSALFLVPLASFAQNSNLTGYTQQNATAAVGEDAPDFNPIPDRSNYVKDYSPPPAPVAPPVAEPDLTKNAACLQGQRNVSIPKEFLPAPKSQGNVGVCWQMGVDAASEVATAKMRKAAGLDVAKWVQSISDADGVAVAMAYASPADLESRGSRTVMNHQDGMNGLTPDLNFFVDGGSLVESLSSSIKKGSLRAMPPDDLQKLKALNASLDKLALTYGSHVPIKLVRAVAAKFEASLGDSPMVDLSRLRGRGYDSTQTQKGSTASAKFADSLSQINSLEDWDAVSSDFAAFQYNSPLRTRADGWWSYGLNETQKDAFFGTSGNMQIIRQYCQQHPGVGGPATLIRALNFVRSSRIALAKKYPDLKNYNFNLATAKSRISEGCRQSSQDIRNYVLGNLCAGTPVIASLNMEGVQIGNAATNQSWWRLPRRGLDSNHEMLITGISVENDKNGNPVSYIDFRNSWPGYPSARIPLNDACRLQKLGTSLAPTDADIPFGKAGKTLLKINGRNYAPSNALTSPASPPAVGDDASPGQDH